MPCTPAFTAPAAPTEPLQQWRVEIRNDRTKPARDLVVTGWYPVQRSIARLPLVMLAPGRGMPASAYVRIAEHLAGHGYAVVGVDSPGSGRQAFADGRTVPPDPALEPPPGLMAGPYIEVDRFFTAAAAAGASDLRFVLDHLQTATPGSDKGFFASIDTGKVGLLGHSLGGRIAGAFAAHDSRAVAWIGVEGLAPRAERRGGLGVPALAILSSGVWPYAIENVRELAWCARQPTYFAQMDGITHNTIADGAGADQSPGELSVGQGRLFETIVEFLDAHLKRPGRLETDWPAGVAIESYFAPSGQRPPELGCRD